MADPESPAGKSKVIEVAMNQQQYVIIEKLRAEKVFGTDDGEIIRRIFQEFVKQEGL